MKSLVNSTEERKRNHNKTEIYRKQVPTYYVIPELYPQFLIGLFDMNIDRKSKPLIYMYTKMQNTFSN